MTPPDALQVIILCHAADATIGDYPQPQHFVDAIHDAFIHQNTNSLVRELSLVEEHGTGAQVRRFNVNSARRKAPPMPAASQLDKALHTVVVCFITAALVNDSRVVAGLDSLAAAIKNSDGRHALVLLGTSEETLKRLRAIHSLQVLQRCQAVSVEQLTEYALRPTYAAILTLNKAHRLLAGKGSDGRATFFISHAKLDGLPLAHALSHTLSRLPWLGQFYDAVDIAPGDDFAEILKRGVLGSMLLVLRTDIYDLRSWCRQEVMWAEAYDRPALLVDARAELLNRPSVLGFTGIPGVRIPDGNLLRIIFEGIREWVRIAILQRRFDSVLSVTPRVGNTTTLLSRSPSLMSLVAAVKKLSTCVAASRPAYVVYPDPPLEREHDEAAQHVIQRSFSRGAVISFKALVAQLP